MYVKEGVNMFRPRKWKLAVIAATTAAAVALTSSAASAAQPGEDPYFKVQLVTGSQVWASADVPSAAVSTVGTNLRAWRSDDNTGRMWLSYNGGPAYQIDGNTFDAPVVTSYGAGGFAIFHTGIDNQIYYRLSNTGQPDSWGTGWIPVIEAPTGTHVTTPFTVSVTTLGASHAGNRQMYMVFRSNDSRRTILGMFFDGSSWSSAADLNATTDHSPAVTYNRQSDRLFVVHTGTDRHVYYNSARYGATPIGNWFNLGGQLDGRPTIATMDNGNMQVAGVAAGAPWYMELNSGGGQLITNWVRDTSAVASLTLAAITLVAAGNTISGFIRNPGDIVFGKVTWRG
jgi:hypothetical protein